MSKHKLSLSVGGTRVHCSQHRAISWNWSPTSTAQHQEVSKQTSRHFPLVGQGSTVHSTGPSAHQEVSKQTRRHFPLVGQGSTVHSTGPSAHQEVSKHKLSLPVGGTGVLNPQHRAISPPRGEQANKPSLSVGGTGVHRSQHRAISPPRGEQAQAVTFRWWNWSPPHHKIIFCKERVPYHPYLCSKRA